ncbi:MAG: hypothetical protein M1834_004458 [Cirrosporium novae-zelandiae]|nr:MAG: hypothetical protein M1834_004458 [Cirrosporium novae-zelandiae]
MRMASSLSEENIDDLLYLSRFGELDDLKILIPELAIQMKVGEGEVVVRAVDEYSGNTCLHMASANGHLETLTYLIGLLPTSPPPYTEPNAILSPRNSSGSTPLHWACLNGHLPVVQLLLNTGADPSIVNNAGHDAVYEAEKNEKNEVVGWLLEQGKGLDTGIAGGVKEEEGPAEYEQRGEASGSGSGDNMEGVNKSGS